MEGKNKFLLSRNILDPIKQLSNEDAGIMFKQILEYVNDLNPEPINDKTINMMFEMIKADLKQDLKSWRDKCGKWAVNGSKGGRPKNQLVKNNQLVNE
jgi:hypothetical protein